MTIVVEDKKYLITDMSVIGKNSTVTMRYNVFDENYKFVKSFTCKDEEEFKNQFKNYLNNKNNFTI